VLCEALKSSSISIISLAECGISVDGISTLAKVIPEMAALSEVKVSFPNGKPLTLVKGMTEMNFSKFELKPTDVEFLAIVITSFPKFTVTLSEVNLRGAKVQESDVVALRSAAPNVSFDWP
jgi:hypothetical protein